MVIIRLITSSIVQAFLPTSDFPRPYESSEAGHRNVGSIPLTRSSLRLERREVVEAFVPNA